MQLTKKEIKKYVSKLFKKYTSKDCFGNVNFSSTRISQENCVQWSIFRTSDYYSATYNVRQRRREKSYGGGQEKMDLSRNKSESQTVWKLIAVFRFDYYDGYYTVISWTYQVFFWACVCVWMAFSFTKKNFFSLLPSFFFSLFSPSCPVEKNKESFSFAFWQGIQVSLRRYSSFGYLLASICHFPAHVELHAVCQNYHNASSSSSFYDYGGSLFFSSSSFLVDRKKNCELFFYYTSFFLLHSCPGRVKQDASGGKSRGYIFFCWWKNKSGQSILVNITSKGST